MSRPEEIAVAQHSCTFSNLLSWACDMNATLISIMLLTMTPGEVTQRRVETPRGFRLQDSENELQVFLGPQRIATYLKQHSQLTRRALVNVHTHSGIPVTRNFPPRKPEDLDPGVNREGGIIHPLMHPGIWISFGDVDGQDYWRLKAKVEFDGFVEAPVASDDRCHFTARNLLWSEDGTRVVCEEITQYEFQHRPSGWQLIINAQYRSSEQDFYFGDQEESGLAVRVASPLRVTGGQGTIVNNHGDRNGKDVWGKQADWFDASGSVDGHNVGMMVLSSPDNPRPSWLHARDYGLIATNPFPKQPRERREPYVKTWVQANETFQLAYAVLIHETPAGEKFDRQAAAQMMSQSLRDFQRTTSSVEN